jgi:hypothetical protein
LKSGFGAGISPHLLATYLCRTVPRKIYGSVEDASTESLTCDPADTADVASVMMTLASPVLLPGDGLAGGVADLA